MDERPQQVVDGVVGEASSDESEDLILDDELEEMDREDEEAIDVAKKEVARDEKDDSHAT